METLVLAAQESDVCAVCPAILSGDRLIANAGLVVTKRKCGRHARSPDGDGYAGSLSCARDLQHGPTVRSVALRWPRFSRSSVYATADFLIADHPAGNDVRAPGDHRSMSKPAAQQRSLTATTVSMRVSTRTSGPARLQDPFTIRISLTHGEITASTVAIWGQETASTTGQMTRGI
jgi:hypothetical protein